MSGHSKWATTKRQKEVADKKRSSIFTKLAKNLTIAAREGGGDPSANFKLRMAIEQARSANMPKGNIERAVKKGTGELKGEAIEEVVYEGIGPENTFFVVEVLTDNKNRSASEIRHIFSKAGGSLGGPNSVMWQFERKGVIRINNFKEKLSEQNLDYEDFELELIDLGADDIEIDNQDLVIYTKMSDLQKLKEALDKKGIETDYVELEYISKELKKDFDEKAKEKIKKLFEALESCDDVNNFYSNVDIDYEE